MSLKLSPFTACEFHFVCEILWRVSNPDTNGAEESVQFSEVSSVQRLKCMQEWYILGAGKVSCLERCPQFRSVLIEGFHCTCIVCIYICMYRVCVCV